MMLLFPRGDVDKPRDRCHVRVPSVSRESIRGAASRLSACHDLCPGTVCITLIFMFLSISAVISLLLSLFLSLSPPYMSPSLSLSLSLVVSLSSLSLHFS